MPNKAKRAIDVTIASMRQGKRFKWVKTSFLAKVDGGTGFFSGAKITIPLGELTVARMHDRPVVLYVELYDPRANKVYHTTIKGAAAVRVWDSIQTAIERKDSATPDRGIGE